MGPIIQSKSRKMQKWCQTNQKIPMKVLFHNSPYFLINQQVVRAAEVTNMRGGRFMSVEDIIFLMRKDKVGFM